MTDPAIERRLAALQAKRSGSPGPAPHPRTGAPPFPGGGPADRAGRPGFGGPADHGGRPGFGGAADHGGRSGFGGPADQSGWLDTAQHPAVGSEQTAVLTLASWDGPAGSGWDEREGRLSRLVSWRPGWSSGRVAASGVSVVSFAAMVVAMGPLLADAEQTATVDGGGDQVDDQVGDSNPTTPTVSIETTVSSVDPLAATATPAIDPATGFPIDPVTGLPIDPATGLPVDPATTAPADTAPPSTAPPATAAPTTAPPATAAPTTAPPTTAPPTTAPPTTAAPTTQPPTTAPPTTKASGG